MAEDFQVGEIVDITVKGARVLEVGAAVIAVGVAECELRLPMLCAEVTRVAPAEWPPMPGDLWRVNAGGLWWCRSYSSLSPLNRGARDEEPGRLLQGFGPLTLVHREPHNGGGDRG